MSESIHSGGDSWWTIRLTAPMNLEENLKLTLLGTGTCVPNLRRNASGYVIRHGSTILSMDMGNGIMRQMLKAKIDYREIGGILITHYHPDHVTDLVPFLFATRHTPGFSREKHLRIIGAHGLRSYLEHTSNLYGTWVKSPQFPFEIQEVSFDEFQIDQLTIKSARVRHAESAVAYRITSPNGRSVTYSGDTGYCESIIELARDTDVLLIECSFPSIMRIGTHLTPHEVGLIAQRANCKKVILTHLYPVFGDQDPTDEVSEEFNGKVVLGEDLLEFEI